MTPALMRIDHPLWMNSALELRSRWQCHLKTMTDVRRHIEQSQHCDDLTAQEHSLLRLLQEWLDQQNAEFE